MFRSPAFYAVLAGLLLFAGGVWFLVSHPYLASAGMFAGLILFIFGIFRLPRLSDRSRH